MSTRALAKKQIIKCSCGNTNNILRRKKMNNEVFLTEGEIWDEVISDWFPNADPDEIEDELESWLKD